jgi:hypothetical protein
MEDAADERRNRIGRKWDTERSRRIKVEGQDRRAQ